MKLNQVLTMLAAIALCASLSACGGFGGGPKGDSNAGAITLEFDGIEKQDQSFLFKRKSQDGSVAEYVQTDSSLQIDTANQALNFTEVSEKMNLPGAIDQEAKALVAKGFALVEKTDYVEKHSAGRLFFAKKVAEEGKERLETVEVLYGLKGPKPQQ